MSGGGGDGRVADLFIWCCPFQLGHILRLADIWRNKQLPGLLKWPILWDPVWGKRRREAAQGGTEEGGEWEEKEK